MNFELIKDNINAEVYNNKIEYPSIKKYPENHVFDADLSVNKNRELVKEHNIKRDMLFGEYKNGEANAVTLFITDCVKAIMNEFNFNESVATAIYYESYSRHHSGGYYEVVNGLHDLCDFVEIIIKASQEKV